MGDRVQIGREVSARLAAAPGVVRPPVIGVDMVLLRDFLGPDECARLIALIDADCRPSRLMSGDPPAGFRTSETCNLDASDPTVLEVGRRMTALTGIDPRFAEIIQGQRYRPGQEFRPHHDFLRTDHPYWSRQATVGGQRTWTLMVFLDVPAEGGRTRFPRLELEVPPRAGTLLAWNNLDATGEPNELTLHQGMPVRAGVKHILTRWYRERPWGPSARLA